MKIESIRLKNYKAFRDCRLDNLPTLVIFIGANGVGKSTLFDCFGFLSDALQGNVTQALAKRGGIKEVRTRGTADGIEIELKFRLEILGKERLVTYLLAFNEIAGKIVVEREILRYKRGAYGSPYHYLDFAHGRGEAVTNEEDFDEPAKELKREVQILSAPDLLAIKGLGQFEKFKAASAFRKFIENWYVADFHIQDARSSQELRYAEQLSPSGENLALVAEYLHHHHPEIFAQVLQKMKDRVPGIAEVKAATTIDGRIVLQFRDATFKDPFIGKFVSDGTIKMFAYLLLLHDPKPHPLLCIEEPENQLYPTLMSGLLEEFRAYGERGGQVMITTHSPELVNAAALDEVFWLTKQAGVTTISAAQDDPAIKFLADEGELLGSLWKQNFFKGSNP